MSKKKAGDASVEKPINIAQLFGCKTPAWPEHKTKIKLQAKKSGFDVERLLFSGYSLAEEIADLATQAIEEREEMPNFFGDDSLLETICEKLANDLGTWFRDGNNPGYTDDGLRLALSFLYLFPKFWKAADNSRTLEKWKALDIDELLSERRKPQTVRGRRSTG